MTMLMIEIEKPIIGQGAKDSSEECMDAGKEKRRKEDRKKWLLWLRGWFGEFDTEPLNDRFNKEARLCQIKR